MTDQPKTPEEIKKLQQEIEADDARPASPAEKPLKIEGGFDSAIDQLSRPADSPETDD